MHNAPATTAFLGSWQMTAQAMLPAISTMQPTINIMMRVRCLPTDLKLKNGISQTNK